ncbi:MAG: lactate utilization protein [Proteobacteria bacterium]|nr:lactate utilization protein [Pseudomonadota bacterium]
MEDREEILSLTRIKNAKNPSLFKEKKRQELLIRWQDIEDRRASHMEELVQTFKRECELLTGKVYVARTNDEACKFLSSIIKEVGIKRIIKWSSPLLKRLEIDRLLNSLGAQNMLLAEKTSPNEVRRKDYTGPASKAELGISGVDYGLADTGTLVLRTSPDQNRATSLLPPVHVAIMESKSILFSSDDLIARLLLDLEEKGDLDSCLTLITGPSLTADIELNLVLGVHGPKELHVIIVESD